MTAVTYRDYGTVAVYTRCKPSREWASDAWWKPVFGVELINLFRKSGDPFVLLILDLDSPTAPQPYDSTDCLSRQTTWPNDVGCNGE